MFPSDVHARCSTAALLAKRCAGCSPWLLQGSFVAGACSLQLRPRARVLPLLVKLVRYLQLRLTGVDYLKTLMVIVRHVTSV